MKRAMRTFGLAVVLCLVFYATPAEACEECAQYFEWQSSFWCWYCREVNCGYFRCEIRQYAAWGDYCSGDDGGCYEYDGNCDQEPSVDLRPLDHNWKLEGVRIISPVRPRSTPEVVASIS